MNNEITGKIIVVGDNIDTDRIYFGCDFSREHTPIALINMGAKAVIADSFAHIFFAMQSISVLFRLFAKK